ncbi:MAG: tetratricopeptide repeat protein [Desulfobulbaceae bacterium]
MKIRKKSKIPGLAAARSGTKFAGGPGPSTELVLEMNRLFQDGKLNLFEQKAREAVRRWPDHPLGWKALGNFFLVQGRHAEALEPVSRCIELAPNDAQARNHLGTIFLALQRFAEAESSFRQAVIRKPDYAEAHTNLGIALMEQGRHEEAAAAHRGALTCNPDFAQAHNNLGNCLKELGNPEQAEESYRRAVALNPDFAEAHCNLGDVQLELGRPGEAEESYRQAVDRKPDYVPAHCGLGDTFLRRGRPSEAIASYRRCLDLDPLWIKALESLNRSLTNLVPLWHVPMMNDRFRNDAYFQALRNAVTPETHVLEIGTGSGLLAMMAARHGARQVTTCEAVAEIADTARDIVAANGLVPPVTVINKRSTKLEIGTDMEERADLLVSEILSSEFLGEGVLGSIEDAKRRLLRPGACIIPARGSIQFALFCGPDIEKNIRVGEVHGFDLSRFNKIVSTKQLLTRNDLNIELFSDDTRSFFFDFVHTDRFPQNEKMTIEVPVRRSGRCCGIIQWLRLEMDDTFVFENHPSVKNPASGWQHCMYIFPEAQDVAPGQVALVTVVHNRNTPWFFLEGWK